jgi:hypothetical protein
MIARALTTPIPPTTFLNAGTKSILFGLHGKKTWLNERLRVAHSPKKKKPFAFFSQMVVFFFRGAPQIEISRTIPLPDN